MDDEDGEDAEDAEDGGGGVVVVLQRANVG